MDQINQNDKEKKQEQDKCHSVHGTLGIRKLSSKVLNENLNKLDVSKIFDSIDNHVKQHPFLYDLAKKYGVKPSYIVLPFFIFLFVSLIFGWGAALICNLLGFAYPAYQSFKAVESQNEDDTKLWLTYWVVFSLFFFFEYLMDIILFWIPFYYLIKLLFLLYLYMPQVKGAVMVYNFIIRPILLKHEKAIDDTVQKISQTATNHLTQITGNITERLVQEGVRRRNVN